MTKGSYYTCCQKGNGGDIKAVATEGYIDGDVGICKSGMGWTATHIPTGLLLASAPSRKDLIDLAQKIMATPRFEAAVTAAKNSKRFALYEAAVKKAKIEKENEHVSK